MPIIVNELSEKYIVRLGKKNVLGDVKHEKAVAVITDAISEASTIAKKDIEDAIEPLRAKIAQKDEFIAQKDEIIAGEQSKNKALQEHNTNLEAENQKLQQYKQLAKEAYRQGITPEIREQKSVLANILTSLIQHQQKSEKVKPVNRITSTKKTHKTTSNSTNDISKNLISWIVSERQHQVLDKERMDRASLLIKSILKDAPEKGRSDIQEHFQKIKNIYLDAVSYMHGSVEKDKYGSQIMVYTDNNGKVVRKDRGIKGIKGEFHPYKYNLTFADNSSVEMYDANSDSYIKFIDENGKELLHIGFSDYYWFEISDKNGRGMVHSSIKDGFVKYLRVIFNDVKSTSEIPSDVQMNDYAKNLIANAKRDTVKNQRYSFKPTEFDYVNRDGVVIVNEDFVRKENKKPVSTMIFNPQTQKREKWISTADFGIHAKFDHKTGQFIQYRTDGITQIEKFGKDEFRDFCMSFYRTTENEHWEVFSLHDRNYSTDFLRPVYEKINYGTASHPLTQSFTYHDLSSKRKIKPWDFSILSQYIK